MLYHKSLGKNAYFLAIAYSDTVYSQYRNRKATQVNTITTAIDSALLIIIWLTRAIHLQSIL